MTKAKKHRKKPFTYARNEHIYLLRHKILLPIYIDDAVQYIQIYISLTFINFVQS